MRMQHAGHSRDAAESGGCMLGAPPGCVGTPQLTHCSWEASSLQDSATSCTPRLLNSSCSLAAAPSSLVHTCTTTGGWHRELRCYRPCRLTVGHPGCAAPDGNVPSPIAGSTAARDAAGAHRRKVRGVAEEHRPLALHEHNSSSVAPAAQPAAEQLPGVMPRSSPEAGPGSCTAAGRRPAAAALLLTSTSS